MRAATLTTPLPLLLLLLAAAGGASAVRRSGGGQLPISSDDRRVTKASECHLGRRVYELGAHWFPDLGPPFGVMHCIRCECVTVKKKRRVVARVQCRNVKDDCPTPSCEHPVLPPGRCCKLCPGDDAFSPDVLPTESSIRELQPHSSGASVVDDDRRKHMAAVLTARVAESLFKDDPERAANAGVDLLPPSVATGRFQLSRRNLYYSLYIAENAPRPRAIQFRSDEGDILTEALLGEGGAYQRATGKVCGAWRRLPRDYRRLLREGRLYAVLLWPPALQGQLLPVAGQIVGHHALGTELFSALLEGGVDAAATAVVSVHAAPETSSVHVSLLLAADVPRGSSLVARLEDEAGRAIVEEVVHASQPPSPLSEVEMRSPVSAATLRHMAAGRLRVTLSAADADGRSRFSLRGRVGTRVACELFQAVVSATDAAPGRPEESPTHAPAPAPPAAVGGVAWMYARRDGSLSYWATLTGLDALPVRMLTLESARGTELYDLTPALKESGVASGDLGAPGVAELRQLYSGDLWLSVATQRAAVARGRLAPKPVGGARDAEQPAYLLHPDAPSGANADAAPATEGLAWIAVDSECTLHIDVTLTRGSGGAGDPAPDDGDDADEAREWLSVQLVLESRPLEAEGAPVWARELAAANASRRGRAFHLEESLADVPAPELAQLEYAVCVLAVRDVESGSTLLVGRLPKTKVPMSCQPCTTDNDVVPVLHQEAAGPAGSGAGVSAPCLWGQRFYDDGAQWREPDCRACHCRRGRVSCERVMCPPAPAACAPDGRPPSPPPGDCCPACHNETSAQESRWGVRRGCSVSGEFHAAGSSWYPYVPPHGFDTCVTVTCDAVTLQVRFWRRRCPALDCGGRRPMRPDPRACCRVCPLEAAGDQWRPEAAGEEQPDPSVVLAAGGCRAPHQVYEDGRTWHPRIQPFGVEKCVTCRCKAGHIQCQRKVCKQSTCARLQDAAAAPEAASDDDDCCRTQCSRKHRRPASPPHG